MSRFIQPLPFSPLYDFVAARVVTINGQNLNPGDPVDKEGLGERRLRQMYESRIITPVAPEVIPVPTNKKGSKKKPVAELQEPAPKADSQPEAIDTQTDAEEAASEPVEAVVAEPAATSGLRAEHRGFGRYFVLDAEGVEVAGPLTKVEANAMVGV